MRLANLLRAQVRAANEAPASEPATPAANPSFASPRTGRRLRRMTFDSWLFVLMLAFVALAVGSSIYVSFTSLRYVFEVIGGMPANVTIAAPLTIDASVAAGLLGEWWLAGRRSHYRFEFSYMVVFGIVFALLTILGNAAHGALTLSVQRPVELLIGGQFVAMPWWVSIAVSAVPGLAIGGSGYAMALIVAVWRKEHRADAPANDDLRAGLDEPGDSRPRPPAAPRPAAKRPDPRVLRIARAGGDWNKVAAATGLGEHAAKRALTKARKQIASEPPPAIALSPDPEVAA